MLIYDVAFDYVKEDAGVQIIMELYVEQLKREGVIKLTRQISLR